MDTKNTLHGFCEYNYMTKEYNTFGWHSYDKIDNFSDYNNYDDATIRDFAIYPVDTFKGIRYNIRHGIVERMHSYHNPCYYKLSYIRQLINIRNELSIDEAIMSVMCLDELPIELEGKVDLDNEKSVTDYVIWYYENNGPMYEEYGDLIM